MKLNYLKKKNYFIPNRTNEDNRTQKSPEIDLTISETVYEICRYRLWQLDQLRNILNK